MAAAPSTSPPDAFEGLNKYLQEAKTDGSMSNFQLGVMQQLIEAKNNKLAQAFRSYPGTDQKELLTFALNTAMLEHQETRWNNLFADVTTNHGKKLSKAERASMGVSKASLVYGEVSLVSIGTVVWGPHVSLRPGGVFYDLGSGTGRGVFCGAFLHDFNKLVGIEILEGLFNASKQVQERYTTEIAPVENKDRTVEFFHGSFLDRDWSDGDLVFANSTCFDQQLMDQIATQARHLKEGATVITLTKSLSSPHFDLVHSKQYRMSWGYATVHVHVRKPHSTDMPDVASLSVASS